MPLVLGKTREYELPKLGKIELRHLALKDLIEAERFIESLPDKQKPREFVRFLIAKLLVSPTNLEIEQIAPEDQRALLSVLVDELNLSQNIVTLIDKSDSVPYEAIYHAHQDKQREFMEKIADAIQPSLNALHERMTKISISGAVANSVIVTGDDQRLIVSPTGETTREEKGIYNSVGSKRILSEEQAFERIGGAARLVYEQIRIDIEQARKESGQIHNLLLIFVVVGFLFILSGVVLIYFNQVTGATVSGVSSVISGTVATLLFKKDTELRKRVAEYHEQLLEIQRILTMIDIAETIADGSIRDEMKRRIIFQSLGIEESTL
ncbi:MAG: hypothetical protein GXO35_07520 [Gammaproteobacteria bacterium]|nr:hypothetical protein [Gammaproteobacteria bacterium]